MAVEQSCPSAAGAGAFIAAESRGASSRPLGPRGMPAASPAESCWLRRLSSPSGARSSATSARAASNRCPLAAYGAENSCANRLSVNDGRSPLVQFVAKKAYTPSFCRLSGKSSVFPRRKSVRRKANPLSAEVGSQRQERRWFVAAPEGSLWDGDCTRGFRRQAARQAGRPVSGAAMGVLCRSWRWCLLISIGVPCATRLASRLCPCALLDQIHRPWPQPDPPIGRRNVRPVCSPGCGATNPQ